MDIWACRKPAKARTCGWSDSRGLGGHGAERAGGPPDQATVGMRPSQNMRTASTMAGPSSAWTLAFNASGVSPATTGTFRWTTTGPPSTSAVTTCTVQPVSVSPASNTALCTSKSIRPECLGNKLGWMLMQAPFQSWQNSGLTMRMKPTSRTRSTPCSRKTSSSFASYSARGVPFLQGTCTPGMPSRLARSRMPASDLFEQITATCAFKLPALIASMVAWEELPLVVPTMPMRMGLSRARRPMSRRKWRLADGPPGGSKRMHSTPW
mmetsp:Transcript_54369/g.157899  ORF Transcript_54369/g.157899 Transcript_54369/m.157899 type:complete len:266 (-) Transcript_54369:1306-2103(-)